MEIFHNDGDKIDSLNGILCAKAGFPGCYAISTQTYTRLVDLRVGNALSEFGAVVQRITGDIRHLASQKEMEEPFEKDQIVRIFSLQSCYLFISIGALELAAISGACKWSVRLSSSLSS